MRICLSRLFSYVCVASFVLLSGCTIGGKMNLSAHNLQYPVSTTPGFYDSNSALVDNADYEVLKSFSFTKSKWRLFHTVALNSDPDISNELNSLIKENNGDAIVNLRFRAYPPSGLIFPPISFLIPNYSDVDIEGNVVKLDKDRKTAMAYIPNTIRTIAVLLMVNNTNDVDAPEKIREAFAEKVAKKNYVVKPTKEVNQILKDEMGITLGKQLDLTTPQEIGKKLGVDGVIYGTLLDFDEKITGVINSRRVRAGFKLVDTRTGVVVWGRGRGVKSETKINSGMVGAVATVASAVSGKQDKKEESESVKSEYKGINKWYELPAEAAITGGKDDLTGVGIAMAAGLAKKIYGKATDSFLKREYEVMLNKITATLPQGTGGISDLQAAQK